MRPRVVIAVSCVAVALLAVTALLQSFGSSQSVSAQDLLAKAADADVDQEPDTVLHLKTRLFLRTKPQELRLRDPYHLDQYATTPEVLIGDSWYQADASGRVIRRYTSVMDESGNLTQESRFSNGESLLYDVASNVVERIPVGERSEGGALQPTEIADIRPGAEIRSAADAKIAGVDAKGVVVDTPPAALSADDIADDTAYVRPYVRDLTPTLVRENFNIDPKNGVVLSYSVDLLDREVSTRVSESLVLALEYVAQSDFPSEFFELKHADGVPLLEDGTSSANSGTFLADSIGDSRLKGKLVVTVPDPQKYGLAFAGVHGSESTVVPAAGSGDAWMADAYGLALTTEYQAPKNKDGNTPTVRIIVGARADLLPLLQSALPFWSRSSPVAVSAFGVSSDAWLVEGRALAAVIFERGDAVVMWIAQGVGVDSLLGIVSESTEVQD